ncbi:hypothetical protein [Streptomyces sp. NPDC097640]|uniref:hypothetical protein n=1 Tax=Streptomyces sp. NPDC097640 TaxID=3157229 RepID=UPI003330BC5A
MAVERCDVPRVGPAGDEPFVVTGDPNAVIASLDLKSWMLDDDAGVDLDKEANEVEWARLAGVLGARGGYGGRRGAYTSRGPHASPT